MYIGYECRVGLNMLFYTLCSTQCSVFCTNCQIKSILHEAGRRLVSEIDEVESWGILYSLPVLEILNTEYDIFLNENKYAC